MTDPVLIVGAGPTGLTAALELTRLGIAVRLVDKREGPADTSRAIGIQARTLELMEQRGLAAEMVRLGNKAHYASVYGAGGSGGGGRRVVRLEFSRVPSRHDYILFLSQAETERILRDALATHGITPEWRTALVGLSQDALSHEPSPVGAVLSTPAGGLERTRAPWLIGAEGAHSLVRATLDLPFEGRTLASHYALGDLHVDGELADTDLHIFSSEHGFMGLFPMGGDHFRLIASDPPGNPSPDSAPTEQELQAIYDQRASIPARFHDTGWSSWFRINSRMVRQLRAGRLLLGGDSAHVHSPAGAQGMNTGMQDMINLCWKLALVSTGRAPMALLDTYAQDRLPVMRGVLSRTESLTGMIGAENHVVRQLFDHLAPWIGSLPLTQDGATSTMAQVALGYRDSPLSDNHAHDGSLRAGDRVPELTVRHRSAGWAERRLQTLLDPSGFVLLVAHGAETGTLDDALARAAAAASVPIRIAELAPAPGHEDYGRELGRASSIYLVRPDGYVALAAGSHSAARALAAFIGRWLTAEPARA